jgi:hypothetical protein
MGISLDKVEAFFDGGYVPQRPLRILDVGCSNLHSVSVAKLERFVLERRPETDRQELRRWAQYADVGGVMHPRLGGVNGLWLGDLLTRAGHEYTAFDIFPGYRTELFDLNERPLPLRHRGRYDCVFNFGTTEHLLGQYNAFRVLHNACAVGGIFYHDLPMTGYMDHGYFCYNPMLFEHLAAANGYEILQLSFRGVDAGETVAKDLAARYADRPYFQAGYSNAPWASLRAPTAGLTAIMRKTRDAPFRASLETSTTVGAVAAAIGRTYDGAEQLDARALLQERLTELLRQGQNALRETPYSVFHGVYEAFVATGQTAGFPITLELASLHAALQVVPDDPGMTARLAFMQELRKERFPLLQWLHEAQDEAPVLALDGVEAELLASGPDPLPLPMLLAAYRVYDEKSALELFPADLERQALLQLHQKHPEHEEVLLRLGIVLAGTLAALP